MDAGKRAASIAAELLAFYREPALRRPPYLHGASPMPDGPVVFRLALGRFPESLGALSETERQETRIAAAAFVRQVCLRERATHYQVLCLEPDAPAGQVRESYHLLIALTHPDRHEAEWPAGGAQRANQAYAVLCDPAQRALYDRQLLKAIDGPTLEGMRAARAPDPAPPRRRRRDAPGRLLARFAVVAGVVAALFIVQAWWVGGVSPQHSLLERAIPSSGRWVRDVLPDPPRFLSAMNLGERLAPIEEPRRMAAIGSWVPVPETRAKAAAPAPVSALSARIEDGGIAARPLPAAAPIEQRAAPSEQRSAHSEPRAVSSPIAVAEASASPVRVAQAPTARQPPPAASPAPGAPSREQVESVVAMLVSHYDGGDADKLVALFDDGRLGFWSELRTRNAYSDFFGATRERRLRIERLGWQAEGATAQARGEAVVTAEYQDGRPRLERRVPVELDIVLRGSQARLARLVLFPNAP